MVTTLKTGPAGVEAPSEFLDVMPPIAGGPEGKNVLSMRQFNAADIQYYIDEARAAEALLADPRQNGIDLLPRVVLTAVMRQRSTRTAGSMATAMEKLGGRAHVYSGMESSSEGKGETEDDSTVAFATQTDIFATRTAENFGPMRAARATACQVSLGNLKRARPVINLGDGQNEHPTQTLGDLLTIYKEFHGLEGLKLAIVGDHERYRAFHSLVLGAMTVGMEITAVESKAAPVPQAFVDELGGSLERTDDLDAAMRACDVLYIGRKPDEYDKGDKAEKERSHELDRAYASWAIDYDRLQQMKATAIVLHPRPRRSELDPSADADHRTRDVSQMENMLPIRMAIIAGTRGRSIRL